MPLTTNLAFGARRLRRFNSRHSKTFRYRSGVNAALRLRSAMREVLLGGFLIPALSPSDGEREENPMSDDLSLNGDFTRDGQGSSLSPSDGERAGVRGFRTEWLRH